jgi:hypothetical protein
LFDITRRRSGKGAAYLLEVSNKERKTAKKWVDFTIWFPWVGLIFTQRRKDATIAKN